ncbi:MAG: Rpn family recombination-promoting nuclease/putative transposase [Treponema sp.]|nr:Rpn family recombination-promoting nuclease/putative transposase [Treponema sp.]
MFFLKKTYKDSVFTDLFGTDRDGKKNFLELYNGLSGNNFKLGEVSLERKIIDQTLYRTYNNDVSWEINGKLIVLVEHQSTVNENMPFRCLEYVTRIYEGIVPVKVRYQEKVFKLPNPDFYVVYVGKKIIPHEQELRLSDAFYEKDGSKLELVVKVKNCSDYTNLPVLNNCDILKQYCRFIEIVEKNYDRHFPRRSLRHAVELAKSEGILPDYLDRKAREVTNMLCAKYDYKTDIAVKKAEAREDGLAEGREEKAIENAIVLIKDYKASPEEAAEKMGAPLDKLLEALKAKSL